MVSKLSQRPGFSRPAAVVISCGSLFAHSDYARMIQGGHYHNQTWGDAAAGILLCVGIHGQTIHVNQNTGVVIVKLSSHPYPSDLGLFGETWRALATLTEAL